MFKIITCLPQNNNITILVNISRIFDYSFFNYDMNKESIMTKTFVS